MNNPVPGQWHRVLWEVTRTPHKLSWDTSPWSRQTRVTVCKWHSSSSLMFPNNVIEEDLICGNLTGSYQMVTYWKLINNNTSHLIKFAVLTIRNQKEFFTTPVSRDLRNHTTQHLPNCSQYPNHVTIDPWHIWTRNTPRNGSFVVFVASLGIRSLKWSNVYYTGESRGEGQKEEVRRWGGRKR